MFARNSHPFWEMTSAVGKDAKPLMLVSLSLLCACNESRTYAVHNGLLAVCSKRMDSSSVESKPKGSTYASLARKRSSDNLDLGDNRHTVHLDYNPNSGVTFRENPNSDVQVVGRGYSEDSSSVYETRSVPQVNTRARDRRRNNNKGNKQNVCLYRRNCFHLSLAVVHGYTDWVLKIYVEVWTSFTERWLCGPLFLFWTKMLGIISFSYLSPTVMFFFSVYFDLYRHTQLLLQNSLFGCL